jgi:hypothetical protein
VIPNKGAVQLSAERGTPDVPRNERPVKRTSLGLRNALFDEIDALRRGDGDPQQALAVANLAKSILATAKLEYQFRKEGIGANQQIKPLPLGDDGE